MEKFTKERIENATIDCFSEGLLEEQHIKGDNCLKIKHSHCAAVVQGFTILSSRFKTQCSMRVQIKQTQLGNA